eukprot:9420725-Pyramimonas_sp.AAC.1
MITVEMLMIGLTMMTHDHDDNAVGVDDGDDGDDKEDYHNDADCAAGEDDIDDDDDTDGDD